MAKRVENKARKEKKLLEQRTLLVDKALEDGKITKKDISEATGLKVWDISNLFAANRELYAKYCVRRKTIVDTAADNIQAIVNDPEHPQHFQASKYVLAKYKSDLDEVLETHDDEKVIEIEENNSGGPVVIRFGKQKEKEE